MNILKNPLEYGIPEFLDIEERDWESDDENATIIKRWQLIRLQSSDNYQYIKQEDIEEFCEVVENTSFYRRYENTLDINSFDVLIHLFRNNRNFTYETFWNFLDQEQHMKGPQYAIFTEDLVKMYWNTVQDISMAETFSWKEFADNTTLRQFYMRGLRPEKLFEFYQNDAILIDTVTLSKTQPANEINDEVRRRGLRGEPIKRSEIKELGMVTRDEVYSLYQIPSSKMDTRNDVYMLECYCPSTGDQHALFIHPDFVKDVKTAIASTFEVPSTGKRMTVDQYDLMFQES